MYMKLILFQINIFLLSFTYYFFFWDM